jgi:DNA-binding CsgD family transcriptional regulator/PAS domain-containing protein
MPPAAPAESRLSDLIDHLYDAAVDERLWAGLVPRIAEVFDSSSAVVKIHGDDGVLLLETTDNLVISTPEQAWADHWHRNDLWVERSVAAGLSQVITSEEIVSRDEQRHSAFYQEWLRRLDIHHMLGATFPVADGQIGVLGIHRPRTANPYTEDDRRKATLLLPHFQRALRLGCRLSGVALPHATALGILDQIDHGVLVVGRLGRIVYANARAERMLRDNRAIGTRNGCLALHHPALGMRLAALIHDNLIDAQNKPSGLAALSIPRTARLPLTLAAVPLRPGRSRLNEQQPLALIFLRDPESPAPTPDQLRDLFGLTRSEAAIAADLGCGQTLARIAETHGIALSTARSHLKQILAKTGTRRQAELVALIARSAATITQPPPGGT